MKVLVFVAVAVEPFVVCEMSLDFPFFLYPPPISFNMLKRVEHLLDIDFTFVSKVKSWTRILVKRFVDWHVMYEWTLADENEAAFNENDK